MFAVRMLALYICSLVSISITWAGESWAPVHGYSSVNQQKAYNNFYFSAVEGKFTEEQTYEHETQVYNVRFSDYDGYWSSNLPSAYYDTPAFDDIDNFTIGSAQASAIVSNKTYFTYMALRKGNSSDCRGCCSDHGGVCCSNGSSMCCDGTPLSSTCVAKGCNQCMNISTVRIKGQLGHRIPAQCHSTWCIFADATTASMCVLSAPAYQRWDY